VQARERERDGDLFVYDLVAIGRDGVVRERWDGLRLRAVGPGYVPQQWAAPLVGPYVARRVQELVRGASIDVALLRTSGLERHDASERAIAEATGSARAMCRRPDGRPEMNGDLSVSTAHAGDLTLAASGPAPLGCDVETLQTRDASVWGDLIGNDSMALAQLAEQEAKDDPDVAVTRVWTARECLRKAGATPNAPMTLETAADGGWIVFGSGDRRIATAALSVRGEQAPLVLAILVASR
jgi:enediyne polyketide synthase